MMRDIGLAIETHNKLAKYMEDKTPVPSNCNELYESQIREYLPYAFDMNKIIDVWDQLGISPSMIVEDSKGKFHVSLYKELNDRNDFKSGCFENLQVACAIATADYIEEGD